MQTSAASPGTARAMSVHASAWQRHVLAAAFAFLACAFGWDGIRSAPAPPKAFRDAALMQTGAQCFVDRCDPYSAEATMQEDAHRGALKVSVAPDELMYPPSTFLLLLPLANADWPAAGILYCWFGVFLVAIACAALVEMLKLERHLVVLLSLLALLVSVPFHITTGAAFNNNLHTGNPTLVAAPLVALGCLLLTGPAWPAAATRTTRGTLGWILLGLALALKPQLAMGPLIALFGHARTRKSSIKAVACGVSLFAIAIAVLRLRLGSFAWFTNWVANSRLTMQGGHILDLSPANPIAPDMLPLQHIAYFFGAPKPWPDVIAWSLFTLVIFGAVMINACNGAWRRLMGCSVALCIVLSVLPVYHNKYDRLILLAVLPALAELDAIGHKIAAWLLALTGAFWVLTEQIFRHVPGRAANWPVNQTVPLLLCALLLWAMAQQRNAPVAPVARA